MSPPAALVKAIAERDHLKTKVDFIKQNLSVHASTPPTESSVSNLLKVITSIEAELEDIQKRILHTAPADAAEHSKEYISIFSDLMTHRCSLETTAAAFPRSAPQSHPTHSTNNDIRLPRIELPIFAGDFTQWLPSVQNSKSLTNTEKLIHLKRSLQGEAAKVIETVPLTETNYTIAWDALTSRYHNERELLFATMKKVFSQKEVSPNSAASIRSLVDTTKSNIRYFSQLGGTLDNLFVYMMFSKFDSHTRELWLQNSSTTKIPSADEVYQFLEQRATALAAGGSSSSNQRQRPDNRHKPAAYHASAQADVCSLKCTSPHRLFKCPVFLEFNVQQRVDHLKAAKNCFNCLVPGHSFSDCKSTFKCRTCGKKHNTLIHNAVPSASFAPANPAQGSHHAAHFGENSVTRGILATAVVRVSTHFGDTFIRVMLDNGSTNSYITHSMSKKLGLHINASDTEISGLSGAPIGKTNGIVNFNIKPHFKSSHTYQIDAFLLEKISNKIPSSRLPANEFIHLHDLQLADPDFHQPGEVDILIGSELFWSILEMEKRCGLPGQPLAIKTTLGWVVAGPYVKPEIENFTFMTNLQLDEKVQHFFQAEEIPPVQQHTPEEEKCEEFFLNNVARDLTTGKFTTPIPWKSPRPPLGGSRQLALRRLLQMEKRLSLNTADPEKQKLNQHYNDEYNLFMKEYLELGHMSKVTQEEISKSTYHIHYIPHHFVLKEDSTSTKFRIVFDGSSRTTSGYSINQAMMIGPTVQSTLFDIILRFRTHPVAFTADIAKMYRQIQIPEEDKAMHHILFRESPTQPIQEYKLNTVTYGTASAPYLTTRTLKHLIDTERANYPMGASIADNSFYVDDLLGGCKEKTTAMESIKQLIKLCSSGGFPLRKWTCNDPAVLHSIPEELRETKDLIPMSTESSVKTLGIHWNPVEDNYSFKIDLPQDNKNKYTKRIVYSEISTLFDPIGWLAPTTVKAKLLMQKIWKLKINWDDEVPETIKQEWIQHKHELKRLEEIKIPRFVLSINYDDVQLIGYADASQLAMAACVYVGVFTTNGIQKLSLLTAKTRVAPLKPPTLPRLELNASVLLIELLTKVNTALNINFSHIKAFSDSQIVLAWIKSDPIRWQPYVKSRVSKIQKLSTAVSWAHIPGKDNPADCASRGLFPNDLIHHALWWNGNTDILTRSDDAADQQVDMSIVSAEINSKAECFHIQPALQFNFITYFSTWKRLVNFTVLVLRAQHNFKARKTSGSELLSGVFTCAEVNKAKTEIMKIVQQACFAIEFALLIQGQALPNKNKHCCLNPFIDAEGIIRVGGRLKHAAVPFDHKHPILLPRHHHITKLIIEDAHEKSFHGGPQLTLSIINQQYWITRGKDAVRFILKRCVLCTRLKAQTLQQIMGNLPKARVTPSKVFQTTGIDYAGPFILKQGQRSKITIKAYLVVFVCFSTKALHLELASSLSTDGFIAAFRRFISRRGKPSDIYTDCGTNFIGAKRTLSDLHKMFMKEADDKKIADEMNESGISWHLNPPGAPHFGGLWEAGVKSVKTHLYHVIGKEHLTYEELNTLIIQIEGILNSRPLTAVSTNPEDLQALTPAHFLIGGPITSLPEPNLHDISIGRLDRWQLIQKKQQSFWKRWSNEYISRLQQRPKWMNEQPQLKLNSIVIIKEENYPPSKWRLGRVIALHPGPDGLPRVATLKTMNGETTRVITKICVLPVE